MEMFFHFYPLKGVGVTHKISYTRKPVLPPRSVGGEILIRIGELSIRQRHLVGSLIENVITLLSIVGNSIRLQGVLLLVTSWKTQEPTKFT